MSHQYNFTSICIVIIGSFLLYYEKYVLALIAFILLMLTLIFGMKDNMRAGLFFSPIFFLFNDNPKYRGYNGDGCLILLMSFLLVCIMIVVHFFS